MNDSKKQDAAPIDDIQLDAVTVDEDDIQQDIAEVEGVALAGATETSLTDVYHDWLRRVRVGDLGSLPIIVGLIGIALIFGLAEPLFFSSRNFVNLLLQMAAMATIAIGVVFVLRFGPWRTSSRPLLRFTCVRTVGRAWFAERRPLVSIPATFSTI